MHRTTTVASVLAGLILVSGCSGSNDTDTSQVAGFVVADVGTDSQPAGRTTPLAGLSPLEVWEKTKADADASPSVQVTSRQLDGTQFNLKMTDKGKVFGLLKVHGNAVLVRRLGGVLYVKAGAPFWTANVGATKAEQLAFKWVVVRKASTADLQQIMQLTDLDYAVSDLMSLSVAEQKGLKLIPGVTIGGRKTVGLVDDSAGDPTQTRRLYLVPAERAMPLAYTVGTGKEQYMRFRSWGTKFRVVVPTGAVELSSVV